MTVQDIIELLTKNYRPDEKLWFDFMTKDDAENRVGFRLTEKGWDWITSRYSKDDLGELEVFIDSVVFDYNVPMTEIKDGDL